MFMIHVLLVLVTHQCLNIAEQCLHSLEVFFFIIIVFPFLLFLCSVPTASGLGVPKKLQGRRHSGDS